MYILLLASLLLIFMGVLIKYFKKYDLINGYKNLTPTQKKKIDVKALGDTTGNTLFAMAGAFILLTASIYYKFTLGLFGSVVLLFVVIAYAFIKLKNIGMYRKNHRFVIFILILAFTFVTTMAIGAVTGPEVKVDNRFVSIGGLYGERIPIDQIEAVSLKTSIPPVIIKTNGLDMGSYLKGNFKLKDIGTGKLFLQSNQGPYLLIDKKKSYTIINYKNTDKTRILYEEIKKASNK